MFMHVYFTHLCVCVCMHVFACILVSERERGNEREREKLNKMFLFQQTCLAAVQDRVWVGSADGNIYTIKRRTKSLSQTLSDHGHSVMAFTAIDNDKYEIPADNNG